MLVDIARWWSTPGTKSGIPGQASVVHPTMIIGEDHFRSLRDHLLRDDGLERVSFLFFGVRGENPCREILVHKVIHLTDADYALQSPGRVVPTVPKQLKVFSSFENNRAWGFMHVHSHPFSRMAEFSQVDEAMARQGIRSLKDYLGTGATGRDFLFGRLVLGRDAEGFAGVLHDRAGQVTGSLQEMKVVGPGGIKTIARGRRFAAPTARPDPEILDRNIRWLGEEGQKKLSGTHLVICGLGGAGGLVALNARGLGFRKITLIDPDRIEKSNLNRLPGAGLAEVGAYKVEVMGRMIREAGTVPEVATITGEAEQNAEAISTGDVIISCVDSFRTRFEIQILAARYLKPLIDIGAGITLQPGTRTIHFMGGQVAAYLPGGPCLACQGIIPRDIESRMGGEVRRATGYVQGTGMTPTAVVTINSIMAGHAVDLLIKYLTGVAPITPYLKCDLLNNRYELFNFGRKNSCLICGNDGIEGTGDEWETVLTHKDW